MHKLIECALVTDLPKEAKVAIHNWHQRDINIEYVITATAMKPDMFGNGTAHFKDTTGTVFCIDHRTHKAAYWINIPLEDFHQLMTEQ